MTLTRTEIDRLRDAGFRQDVIAAIDAEAGRMRFLWLYRRWWAKAAAVLAGSAIFMLITASLIQAEANLGWPGMALGAGGMMIGIRRLMRQRAHPDRAGAHRVAGLLFTGRASRLERIAQEISCKADPAEALALASGLPRPLSPEEQAAEREDRILNLKGLGLAALIILPAAGAIWLAWLGARP